MTQPPLRILVTGDHDDDEALPKTTPDGRPLEWISLPVLSFERLTVDPDLVYQLVQKPSEWILFTSPRAVRFWSEVLLANGVDFPLETQVACIGERTAEVASRDGFNPDFYPTEPGTEKFLEEFEDLVSNNSVKPTVFIPMAEGGRTTIRDRLGDLGCEVLAISLYRTTARNDLRANLTDEQLAKTDVVLFTSPSSVDAFTSAFSMPPGAKIASIGQFTSKHLKEMGYPDHKTLPQGDFRRIAEVL